MYSRQPLNIGFVGGSVHSAIGNVHRIASSMDRRFSLASGCFSRNSSVNSETANAWGVAEDRLYPDFLTMLNNERGLLDAVVVLTPVNSHFEVIREALRLGVNVISEKPLCSSPSEVQQLRELQQQSSKKLLVTFNYTGYPMVRELKRRVERGDFGSIHSVRLTMQQEGYLRVNAEGAPIIPQSWRLEDSNIPTVSLDLGTHVFHLLHFVLGVWPKRVFARMSSNGNFPVVVDDVDVLADLDDGSHASAWWSKCALGHQNGLSIEIFGSEGSAYWLQADPESILLSNNAGHKTQTHRGSRDCLVAQEPRYNRFKMGHPSGFIEAFSNLYYDISEALRSQQTNSFVFDADNSLMVMRALEALSASAKTQSWKEV
jgi:predicted dehydrogenase